MAAYFIAYINVSDPDRYAEYSKLAAPALKQYGGKVLARGGAKFTLEGSFPYARVFVAEFPDAEAARRYHASPEYQQAREKRLGAAEFNAIVVEAG
jgi:uncharacterized protein (DUF1330 family)